jgi:hypothetical protein
MFPEKTHPLTMTASVVAATSAARRRIGVLRDFVFFVFFVA